MQNLVDIKKSVLYNTLGADKVGVYTNSVNGKKVLFLKEYGVAMEAPEITKISRVAPVARETQVILSNRYPVDSDNYAPGITVKGMQKVPGVRNDDYYDTRDTYVGNVGRLLSPSSGKIDNLDIEQAVKGIVEMIIAHDGIGGVSTERRDALVDPFVYYSGLFTSAASEKVNIVIPSTGIDKDVAVNGINADSDVNEFVEATVNGTTSFILKSKDAGDVFFVRDAASGGVASIDNDGMATIYLERKSDYPLETFEIEMDSNDGAATIIVSGNFEYMSSDDVFREFSQMDHLGFLGNQVRGKKPVDGVFAKYSIVGTTPHGALEGASHQTSMNMRIDMYVLASELSTDYFKSTDMNADAPSSPDMTFDELIQAAGFATLDPYTTASVTFATNSTSAGTVFISIDGQDWAIPIATGQTPTQITASLKAVVNGFGDFTAEDTAGLFEITNANGITNAVVTSTLGGTTVSAVTLS